MFCKCKALTELNISKFNISNVIDTSFMFSDCTSLNNLNIPKLFMKEKIYADYMFSCCKNFIKARMKKLNRNIKEEALRDVNFEF